MTKLCARGKAAAKRKFKVYPSAYANAYASKICAGKIKDPSGVKRKDFKGPKPASANEGKFMNEIEVERLERQLDKDRKSRAFQGKPAGAPGQGRYVRRRDLLKKKASLKKQKNYTPSKRGLNTSDVEELMDAMPKFDDGGINYKKIAGMGMVGGHNVMGSPVSVDVDGDTLSNPSASSYYKDLLK